MAVNENGPLTL